MTCRGVIKISRPAHMYRIITRCKYYIQTSAPTQRSILPPPDKWYRAPMTMLPAGLPILYILLEWLGSRVVSVLDSGAEGPGFKSQPRRCRVTVIGKLFTPIVPLFTKQRKLVAALLRVARVTAGLEESNGSLPPGL